MAVFQQLYPNRVAGRARLEHINLLPYSIHNVYEETKVALENSQPVLAGIGIRAIVESVCKDKGTTGNNLDQRIDRLAEMGHVTSDGAAILHNLRFMGNDAAHEVKAHSNSELSVAFEVIDYLLNGVYIIPQRALILQRKS